MDTIGLAAPSTERPLEPAAPVPNGAPPQPGSWIVLGPRLREHLGPALERAMPLVWVALLEMSGVPEGAPYRLVVDGAHIEPLPPAQAPQAGVPLPAKPGQ